MLRSGYKFEAEQVDWSSLLRDAICDSDHVVEASELAQRALRLELDASHEGGTLPCGQQHSWTNHGGHPLRLGWVLHLPALSATNRKEATYNTSPARASAAA